MSYCPLNKFKNVLGIPKRGVHSYRILNTAVVDYIFTLIAAFITSYATTIPLVLTTIGWFILGLALHILFGVQTSTLTFLGVKCN